jgi:cell division protein FtsA
MIGRMNGTRRDKRKTAEIRPGVYAALDVGSSKVVCLLAKVEQGREGVRPKTKVIGVGYGESAGIRQGQIAELDRVEASIRQVVTKAEEMADTQIEDVFISFSCGKPQSQIVRVETPLHTGEATEADIRRLHALARQQAHRSDREIVHSAALGYAVDAATGIRDPRGMFGDKLGVSVHMVSAALAPLHNLEACVEKCHLEISGRAVAAYAAGMGCLHDEELEYGATIVDMGGGTTSIAAFQEGKLVFCDVIAVGGRHITNDIVRGLSTPFREAERLKTLHGNALPVPGAHGEMIRVTQIGEERDVDGNRVPREELISIIQPRVEETIELVSERMKAAGADKVGGNVVVLTGGASELMGLQEFAARALAKRVRIGRPMRLDALPPSVSGPAFSAVAGLVGLAQAGGPREQATAILAPPRAQSFGRIGAWIKETFL